MSFAPLQSQPEEVMEQKNQTGLSTEVWSSTDMQTEIGSGLEIDWATHVNLGHVANRDIACLNLYMPVEEARDLLLGLNIQAAPVVDAEGHPVGMVFLNSLMLAAAALDSAMEEWEPDPLYAETATGIRYTLDSTYHVDRPTQGMVGDVVSARFELPETASVAHAAGLMHWARISHIVVTDGDGKAVAMVSVSDIAEYFAEKTGCVPWIAAENADGSTTSPLEMHAGFMERPTVRNRRILVVDDDAAICNGLVDLLEDEGFEAIRALNGREALEILHSLPVQPGLILLDLMMPTMNGWEFRQEQLKSSRLRPIPVVVLSAFPKSLKRVELRSPAAVLAKPVGVDTLLHAVQQHYRQLN